MHDTEGFRLSRESTALIIVDFQERLFAAMAPERKGEMVDNTRLLLHLAATLPLPVLLTEQYPQGLGRTVPKIAELLPEGARILEKNVFSAWRAEGFAAAFRAAGARTAILTGMESHVCVLGTALDMREAGVAVHVPRDAVISREERNRITGLDLMDRAGALVTSTETVIFQLLDRAGTPEFKTMSKLLK